MKVYRCLRCFTCFKWWTLERTAHLDVLIKFSRDPNRAFCHTSRVKTRNRFSRARSWHPFPAFICSDLGMVWFVWERHDHSVPHMQYQVSALPLQSAVMRCWAGRRGSRKRTKEPDLEPDRVLDGDVMFLRDRATRQCSDASSLISRSPVRSFNVFISACAVSGSTESRGRGVRAGLWSESYVGADSEGRGQSSGGLHHHKTQM